jgi:ribokinase
MHSPRQTAIDPPRLLVVGPITRDAAVLVERLPEAGEAVDAAGFHTSVGGKGGTVALGAAALGAEVDLLGAVGTDDQGDLSIAELISARIGVHAVERLVGETTGHVLTWIGTDAGRRHVEWHGANSRARCTPFAVARAASGADAVIVSGASPAALVEAAVEGARAAGARVVLDAAGDPETACRVLADVDVVRGDAAEVGALVDVAVEDFDSAAVAAQRLLGGGPKIAIVGAGDQGDIVATAEGDKIRLPHLDVDVVDRTGAGDAFVATFTVLLCGGRPPATAARLASAAAAHTASHLGGRPTFAGEDDLAAMLGEHSLLSTL